MSIKEIIGTVQQTELMYPKKRRISPAILFPLRNVFGAVAANLSYHNNCDLSQEMARKRKKIPYLKSH